MTENIKQKASPATRRLAKALGIDLNEVKANNENGRVEPEDIERYLKEQKNNDTISENISINKVHSNLDDDFRELEERINMLNEKADEEEHNEDSVQTIYTSQQLKEETKESDSADTDIIQFMIKHQNDIYDENETPKDIIVNYDKISNSITSEIVEDEGDRHFANNEEESIGSMNNSITYRKNDVIAEEIVSKEFDEKGEEIPIVPIETNVIHQVIVPLTEDPDDYPQTEREINESFGKRVVITLNDDTNNSVVINKENANEEEGQVVIETHSHNVVSMGIKADLGLIKEMLVSYSGLSEHKIFNTVVKAIVFAIEKNEISSFDGCVKIGKYKNGEIVENMLEGIKELTVSQMDKHIKEISKEKEINYAITDITNLGIDYFYPKVCEQKVEISVLVRENIVKVFINACEDLMSFTECAKVLSTIKSVINNPSLMLV